MDILIFSILTNFIYFCSGSLSVSDKKYDLFCEHSSNRIINKKFVYDFAHNYRENYISRVAKLFDKNIIFLIKPILSI